MLFFWRPAGPGAVVYLRTNRGKRRMVGRGIYTILSKKLQAITYTPRPWQHAQRLTSLQAACMCTGARAACRKRQPNTKNFLHGRGTDVATCVRRRPARCSRDRVTAADQPLCTARGRQCPATGARAAGRCRRAHRLPAHRPRPFPHSPFSAPPAWPAPLRAGPPDCAARGGGGGAQRLRARCQRARAGPGPRFCNPHMKAHHAQSLFRHHQLRQNRPPCG